MRGTRWTWGLLLAAAACGGAGNPHEPTTGRARVTTSLTADQQAGIAGMTLTVRPGDGPTFSPMVEPLTQDGTGWSAYVTGIPAGVGRVFAVAALDASGATLFSGSAKADIVAGAEATVQVTLVASTTSETSLPILDAVSASAPTVAPGGTIHVAVTAHDTNPGVTLAYQWSATCGAFATPAAAGTDWTAPATGPTSCLLTITVSDGSGASASASIRIGIARTISGTRLVRFWPDPPAATVTAPAPDVATATAPEVLVRDATGGWVVLPGGNLLPDGTLAPGFAADGSFAVPEVPGGPFVLCYAPPAAPVTCVDTVEGEVDLGYDVLGRADQALATGSTPVTFTLSGLGPWNPLVDELQLTSSNADLFDVAGAGGVLRGGDVAGTLVEDFLRGNGLGASLTLLASADTLFVHQLSTRSIYDGGLILRYAAATHATLGADAISGATLTNGQAASLGASLSALPLTASYDLAWNLPAFEAQVGALAPPGRTSLGAAPHLFRIGASAFTLDAPAPAAAGGAPELVRFELGAGLGAIAGTLNYGRFLPAPWQEWQEARFVAEVSYLAPGASAPFLDAAVLVQRAAMDQAGVGAGPAVTPVQAPRIAGADAFQDATGVGLTPRISWTPPATGAPTDYVVEVASLAAAGSASNSTTVLRYLTSDTAVTLPPGVLQTGGTYYARITAEESAVPYASSPFRLAGAFARATVLTATFTP